MKDVLLDPQLDDVLIFRQLIRPLKSVCLVADSCSSVTNGVSYLCQTWGGAFSWLIPLSLQRPRLEPWLSLLDWFQPDAVFLLAEVAPAAVDLLRSRYGIEVRPAHQASPYRTGGLSMHAVVVGMQESDGLGWNENLPLLTTQCSGWDTWMPSMLATLGYVDEASVARPLPFRPEFTLPRVLKSQQPFPLSGRTFDDYWNVCWDQHLTSPRGARAAISPRLLTCHKTARHPSTDGNSPFFIASGSRNRKTGRIKICIQRQCSR